MRPGGSLEHRIFSATVLLMLIWLVSLSVAHGGVAATPALEIVSVIVPSEVPYDKPVPVRVTVMHAENATPSVSVYYWVDSESKEIAAGWRIVVANPVQTIPEWNMSETVFAAALPSPVFVDVLSYGTRLVLWVEAVFKSVRISTAPERDRWNPYDLQGKSVIDISDPYPPAIESVAQEPKQPTSSDPVLVRVKLAKNPLGAGIARADLEYSVNGTFPGTIVTMLESGAGIFEVTIPAQANGASVAYRISTVDEAGNGVVGDWIRYLVGPSEAERRAAEQIKTQQEQLLQRYLVLAVGVVVVVIGAIAYLRRARLRGYLKSRGVSVRGTYDVFSVSAMISILVVAWTAYAIMQYGHVWLGLAALVVEVELMAVLDPRIRTLFGLFGTPTPKPNVLLDSLRSPGTPLLVSAYALLFVGILSTLCIYVAGFVDRQGFLAIIDFFASYALIMVGLAGVVRYLAYRQFRSETNQA
jgi:hypothetical protein